MLMQNSGESEAMLNQSLHAVKQQLEQHLLNHYGLDESIVVLNQLVEQDGSAPAKNKNKMVITLLNLSQETNQQFINTHKHRHANAIIKSNPSLRFNLYLLFTACFDDYEEALKFLSSTITFFQANSSLNINNSDVHDQSFQQSNSLQFEIENASHQEIHNLWSAMGAKYQPSILYKVKYITIQSHEIRSVEPQIDTIGTELDA
jgi:hypothetical protein